MQVGGAHGLAVRATLSSARTNHLRAAGSSRADALTSGLHLALSVGAGLLAVAVVIATVVLRPADPAEAGAERAEGRHQPDDAEAVYAQAA